MPRPSSPNPVAATRIPITRVTTLMPIGPSRRAIGAAERNAIHMIAQILERRRLDDDRRDRAGAHRAWNRERHDRQRFPVLFRLFSRGDLLGSRQLQFFHRDHAHAVLEQDQAAGGLQHRHVDAEDLQHEAASPGADEKDAQHGERALIGHPRLD